VIPVASALAKTVRLTPCSSDVNVRRLEYQNTQG
jgi:hypothetical protein